MNRQSKDRRDDLRPVIITAIVAIGATAGILFNDFGPSSAPQDSSTARMVTAAAISRAGAIEIPSKPPAGASASQTNLILQSFHQTQEPPGRS
jgi:hypothetical protein